MFFICLRRYQFIMLFPQLCPFFFANLGIFEGCSPFLTIFSFIVITYILRHPLVRKFLNFLVQEMEA